MELIIIPIQYSTMLSPSDGYKIQKKSTEWQNIRKSKEIFEYIARIRDHWKNGITIQTMFHIVLFRAQPKTELRKFINAL